MRYVLVIAIVLLLASTSSGAHRPRDPLDVLFLVDFSAPPGGSLNDRQSVLEASEALLAALRTRSKEGGYVRVLPFAEKLATNLIWQGDINRGLDAKGIRRKIKNAMLGPPASDYPPGNIGDPMFTDFASVLTDVNKWAPYSDAHFPVLVIVSNGIDDADNTQRCSSEPRRSVMDDARRQLLDVKIQKLRRRVVLFMTPCYRDEYGNMKHPFEAVWHGMVAHRLTFYPVKAWDGPARPDRTPEAAAIKAISSLEPVHLSTTAPAPVHGPGGRVVFQVSSDITFPVRVMACLHRHPPAPDVLDASAHVTPETLDRAGHCPSLSLAPDQREVVSMQFHPPSEIVRQNWNEGPALGFRLELEPGPGPSPLGPLNPADPDSAQFRAAELRSLVFPLAMNIVFRYEWPCWLCPFLFDSSTQWVGLGLGIIPLGFLILVAVQRYHPILPVAWMLNGQLFEPEQSGNPGAPRSEKAPLFPVGIAPYPVYGGSRHVLSLPELTGNLNKWRYCYTPADAIAIWRCGDQEAVLDLAVTSTAQIQIVERHSPRATWTRLDPGKRRVLSSTTVTTLLLQHPSNPGEAMELDLSWTPGGDRVQRISRLVFFHPRPKEVAWGVLALSMTYFVFIVTGALWWNLSDQTLLGGIGEAGIPILGTAVWLIPLSRPLAFLRSVMELLHPVKMWWERYHHHP